MKIDCGKMWYRARSQMYSELARKKNFGNRVDSVFFRMGAPDVGCIDFDIFVNGEKQFFSMFSEVFDPFQDIRDWLEAIVKGNNPILSLRIDTEGPQMLWVYEMLPERNLGLFYLYEASCGEDIVVKAVVDTKEFVTALYLALLDLAANGYNRMRSDFGQHWYEPQTLWKRTKRNNWTFYNAMKSPLIEWYLYSNEQYSSYKHRFVKAPRVKEVIQMWCDYGDALFWGRGDDMYGACIGGTDEIYTYSAGTIELSRIEGLQEWYKEWRQAALPENDDETLSEEWVERGRNLALKVREILPDTIDLFFYDWYPAIEVQKDDEYHFPERLPMIVP